MEYQTVLRKNSSHTLPPRHPVNSATILLPMTTPTITTEARRLRQSDHPHQQGLGTGRGADAEGGVGGAGVLSNKGHPLIPIAQIYPLPTVARGSSPNAVAPPAHRAQNPACCLLLPLPPTKRQARFRGALPAEVHSRIAPPASPRLPDAQSRRPYPSSPPRRWTSVPASQSTHSVVHN